MEAKPPPAGNFSLTGMLIIAVFLIILSMVFSASESGFLSLNKLRIRILRKKKDKRIETVQKLLERKEKLLNTLLVANELVNILLSAILTAVAIELFGATGVGIATIVVTILLLVFGEITPKTIASKYPEHTVFKFSGFIRIVVIIMRPVVFICTAVSRFFLGFFGIKMQKPTKTFTEEEIKTYIDAGGEEGLFESDEKNMMHRVFKFNDLEAQDIMVPRKKIIAIPYTASYRQIMELSEQTHISRFPVYKKDIDNIVGIMYVKDLLFFNAPAEEFSLTTIMREPLFVSGVKKMSSIQFLMRENHQTFAVVVDEYSGTDGILTQSDISRKLFGSFEENLSQGRATIESVHNSEDFIIGGTALIRDVSELLHITLESDINETIGGWLIEKKDTFPEKNDYIDYEGYRFTVCSIENMVVTQVHIKNLSKVHTEQSLKV